VLAQAEADLYRPLVDFLHSGFHADQSPKHAVLWRKRHKKSSAGRPTLTFLNQLSSSLRIPTKEKRFTGLLMYEDVQRLSTRALIDKLQVERAKFYGRQDCALPLYLAIVFAERFLAGKDEDFVETIFQEMAYAEVDIS
jgi:hypothetical protein